MEPAPFLQLDFATLPFVDFSNSPISTFQHASFLSCDVCGRRYENRIAEQAQREAPVVETATLS